MNISTETREILRNYKAVINARRREMGQKPLTTAQIVDEICDFVANQQAVFLGGHYILPPATTPAACFPLWTFRGADVTPSRSICPG
ncbi:Uncharacterised protein [Shigella sonnei]|uniref:hypothetical protein n=1 Tax=Shigella sonnei TaxID=624 RepID=UPI0006643BE9|nr:hypothetical protein [Shigella sonnei]CSI50870.1 Uncharacterised protein [Shigella sonnei]